MGAKATHLSVSGIYRIDGPNGKFYIGSAKWVSRRWIEHKRDLKRGTHGNPKLQCAWNKHGAEAFTITVVEAVPELEKLIEREQFWIDSLNPVDGGYNVKKEAKSPLGLKHSEETKRRMSEAHKGKKHGPMSEEQKAYYSQLYKGRKLSEETRRKMGEARKGKPRPPHVIEAIRAANTGKKLSDEHRVRLSEAKKGKSWTEAQRRGREEAVKRRREQTNLPLIAVI